MADPELIPVEDRPVALTVAGFDPSGGAGVLTDAAAIRAFGVHPVAVLTSLAVQNTVRFFHRRDLPAGQVREQLDAVAGEFLLGAVKTGMLGTVAAVDTLADWLAERPRLPLVVDPVLRSSSGGDLGEPGLGEALTRRLFPRTRLLTPNLPEAAALTGRTLASRADMEETAGLLRALGPEWVLLKGGHLPRGDAADYLAGPEGGFWLEEPRVRREVRGTGCALAAAVAAGLARGDSVPDAARAAKRLVTFAIGRSYVAGQGRFLTLEREPGQE